jgi:hypothetical protein
MNKNDNNCLIYYIQALLLNTSLLDAYIFSELQMDYLLQTKFQNI